MTLLALGGPTPGEALGLLLFGGVIVVLGAWVTLWAARPSHERTRDGEPPLPGIGPLDVVVCVVYAFVLGGLLTGAVVVFLDSADLRLEDAVPLPFPAASVVGTCVGSAFVACLGLSSRAGRRRRLEPRERTCVTLAGFVSFAVWVPTLVALSQA